MDTTAKPTVVSKTEARQATNVRGTLPVLVIGTVGAFIVLAGLYIYYFGLRYEIRFASPPTFGFPCTFLRSLR